MAHVNQFEVTVSYDNTALGHAGIFCDFNGGGRIANPDGSRLSKIP